MAAARKRPGSVKAEDRDAARSRALVPFVDFALGDPRLSAWEANFVVSMSRLARGDGPGPSQRQLEVVTEISAKIGFGCEARQPVPSDLDEVEDGADTGEPLDLVLEERLFGPQQTWDAEYFRV